MKCDKKTVGMIQCSFKAAREVAQKSLHEHMKKLQGHTHGSLCFSWRHCRKVERKIVEIKKQIKEYNEAEVGLAKGRYSKAIEILGRASEQIELQAPMRVVDNPPEMAKAMDNSAAIAFEMEQARNYLISFQPSYQG